MFWRFVLPAQIVLSPIKKIGSINQLWKMLPITVCYQRVVWGVFNVHTYPYPKSTLKTMQIYYCMMHLEIIKITYNRTATHFMDDRFVNLGEEVILTLLWQSGYSESATVCFVISWSICYWLFKCWVLLIVCVCVCVCVCASVCVWERGGFTAKLVSFLFALRCIFHCVRTCV